MSLKAFHIIFVIVTTLLFAFLTFWGFKLAPPHMADSAKWISYAGIAGLIIMPIYGIIFYKKVKNIIV